ncbi:MAG: hypothetical protein KAS32_28365 [Candidatus Peribacteraceae bacterium]|nr:hypothetical protein [Candidatus Peribacteraceae bacterium]
MAYRGKFRPRHPEKYMGDPKGIVYRSSWEREFFNYCDNSAKIKRWASEEIIVPYYYLGKKHRYFPDVYIEYMHHSGVMRKKLIEIKPYGECFPPRQSKNRGKYARQVHTYGKNQAKWAAAIEFCELNSMEWEVFTEYTLQLKKPTQKMIREGLRVGTNTVYRPITG